MEIRPNTRLKSKLLENGITQRDLALELKISELKISGIIRGWEKPTSEIKEMISDFLNTKPEELFI